MDAAPAAGLVRREETQGPTPRDDTDVATASPATREVGEETHDAADADVVSQLSSLSLAGTDPCSPRSPRTPKDACVVCWERRREVACYPCMHVCLCAACAGAADACPMCRRPVEDVFRVFLS